MTESYDQLNIFSFLDIQHEQFCWDNDINNIYDRLTALVSKHNLTCDKAKWEIWEHVPQYGYRMTFTIQHTYQTYTDDFITELSEIVDFAKSRNVELSPHEPHFFGDIGYMYIYSTFMDKKRRKVR